MERKTLVNISINNANNIMYEIDVSSIELEEPLRIIHSILDEMRLDVLNRINEMHAESVEDLEDDDLI